MKDKWIDVLNLLPDEDNKVYWVVGGKTFDEPTLCYFNDYTVIGGKGKYWQTVRGQEDYKMTGTKYISIDKPSMPTPEKPYSNRGKINKMLDLCNIDINNHEAVNMIRTLVANGYETKRDIN